MDTFFYRFRPVARLLGKEGSPGELEQLAIYFATPAQLNDPLEGYKDYFWAGDAIVWRNLLRHYILCLSQHCVIYLLTSKDEKILRRILVEKHLDDLPGNLAEILQPIIDRFMNDPDILSYIDALATDKHRKFRRTDLAAHFKLFHMKALSLVFSGLAEAKLCPENFASHIAKQAATRVSALSSVLEALKSNEDPDTVTALFEQLNLFYEQARLLSYREKWPEGDVFIRTEFPYEFVKALEALTHPDWYTACFMSDCSNSSIWGTYGENHAGVCLKYKLDQPSPNERLKLYGPIGEGSKGIIKEERPFSFYKIDYGRSFTEIDFFKSLGNLPVPTLEKYWYGEDGATSDCGNDLGTEVWRSEYWDRFIQSVTVKLKDWQFENEYRLILAPSIIDIKKPEDRVLNYRLDSLDGVIFGINTKLSVKHEVVTILEKLCASHPGTSVKIYQARYDPKSKTIKHDEFRLVTPGRIYTREETKDRIAASIV